MHTNATCAPPIRSGRWPNSARPAMKATLNAVNASHAGVQPRWAKNNPMNVQLVPEPFVEIPVELANEKGIAGGDRIKVSSARSDYIAKAMVTNRIKPMIIDGKKTYQIGIPIHWGYRGIAEDQGKTSKDLANQLSPTVFDPNAYTPEFKGFLVKIEKV